MKVTVLDEWEHPSEFAKFQQPRQPGEPRTFVAVLTIGPWDFGIYSAKPGGYRYLDIYLGVRGVQIDSEPAPDDQCSYCDARIAGGWACSGCPRRDTDEAVAALPDAKPPAEPEEDVEQHARRIAYERAATPEAAEEALRLSAWARPEPPLQAGQLVTFTWEGRLWGGVIAAQMAQDVYHVLPAAGSDYDVLRAFNVTGGWTLPRDGLKVHP